MVITKVAPASLSIKTNTLVPMSLALNVMPGLR